MQTMDTFLPPIEHPRGLTMKLAYHFMRKQFGKVLTPVKVHSARLPAAFGMFYGKIGKLDKKLALSPEMVLLIRHQVARINVCEFCMDIGRAFAIQTKNMNQAKFDALGDYRTNMLFTEAERAALDYVTELTKEKKANRETFDRMARHYSEREICEIVWLVASEHLYNMTNIGLNIHSDMLCDISLKKMKPNLPHDAKITPFLWFNDQAEEAAKFYISIFKKSKILNVARYSKEAANRSGRPPGSVMTVVFEIEGQRFIALNGGPYFKFNEAVSFVVNCKNQAELDRFWKKLTAGGEEGQCGWLKDKYGVSWQIVPSVIGELLSSNNAARTTRVMEALLQMRKLDIKALQKAYDGGRKA